MTLSLPQSPWFYRLLNAALLLLVAWLGAGLLWLLFTPSSKPPLAAAVQHVTAAPALDLHPLNRLFAPPSQGDGSIQPTSLNIKLRAVVASQGSLPAIAIFQTSAPIGVAIKVGGEIEPGVTLVEVHADHALIDNQGRRERVELDATPAASGISEYMPPPPVEAPMQNPELDPIEPPPPSGPTQGKPPKLKNNQIEQPVASFAGPDRLIQRQQLAQSLSSMNVSDMGKGLSESPAGGISLDNASQQPLASSLGLQTGDVLKQINGASLNKPTDISALYGAFSRDEKITISLLRGGAPLTLNYRIKP